MDRLFSQTCATIAVLAVGSVLLAGCSPKPMVSTENATAKLVVLGIDDNLSGPIQGHAQCKDDNGRPVMKPQCLASYDILLGAVFSCGPSKVTVDRSWTHSEYVSFPTNWAPGNPSSLDAVKCIQSKVGFPFSAVIASATEPGEFPAAGDDAPFRVLHSRKQP